jgi:ABC-2 type transport system ATP-binding protein
MNILEARNLKKYYATQKAVDDISFSIKEGQIFGLLGPNGAGKTTLLRMITEFFIPMKGKLFLTEDHLIPQTTFARLAICQKKEAFIKK